MAGRVSRVTAHAQVSPDADDGGSTWRILLAVYGSGKVVRLADLGGGFPDQKSAEQRLREISRAAVAQMDAKTIQYVERDD